MHQPALREPYIIVSEFNETIRVLLLNLETKSRDEVEQANIARLRSRLAALRRNMGANAVIAEAAPGLIKFSEQILDEDTGRREKFFLSLDPRAVALSAQDEFVYDLADSVREHYRVSLRAERDELYLKVRTLLTCCIEYQLLATDG